MATEDLTRVLDEAGARYELLPHARTERGRRGGGARLRVGGRRKDARSNDSGGRRVRKLVLGGVFVFVV